jgi:hypothetical protein
MFGLILQIKEIKLSKSLQIKEIKLNKSLEI